MEYISKKYYKKLKNKLFNLEVKKKRKLITQLKKSIEKGDLSENYEYISIKESLEILELKINKIKNTILNSKIIDNYKKTNKVEIFSTVIIKNLNTKKKEKFTLVSPSEADIFKNKISIKSPVSLILINKRIGNIIKLPNNIKYKIIKIK